MSPLGTCLRRSASPGLFSCAAVIVAIIVTVASPPASGQDDRGKSESAGGIRPAKDVLAREIPAPDATPSYRWPSPLEVLAPPGYDVEVFAAHLDFPVDVAFSEQGEAYIAEAGFHGFGDDPLRSPPPQIIQIRPDATRRTVYENTVEMSAIRGIESPAEMPEGIIPPITGITWHRGKLYVSHRTRISVLDPTDENPKTRFRTIVRGLPSWGPYANGKVVFDRDGRMVFFVPSASNAGVVDEDLAFGILIFDKLKARDIPGEDVTLTGRNFLVPLEHANRGEPFIYSPDELVELGLKHLEMPIPYTHIRNLVPPRPGAKTGAFQPLWTESPPGQVVKGEKICTGAFYRCDPDGKNLERIAWGYRDSGGYGFAPDGRLICTESGVGPARPRGVLFDRGAISEVVPGEWHGWPDFLGGLPITDPRYADGGEDASGFLLTPETHRSLLKGRDRPRPPLVRLPPQTNPRGLVFGRPEFGVGSREVLVAEMGSIDPLFKGDQLTYSANDREERAYIQDRMPRLAPPDIDLRWPGFKIQRVNLDTGQVRDFLTNEVPGPATAWRGRGLERPVQLEWGPDGALYIVDLGVVTARQREKDTTLNAHIRTGVIWRVARVGEPAHRPTPSGQIHSE